MSSVDIRKIRPLNDDVVLCLKKEQDVQKSVIYYEEDVNSKTLQYFEVISVAPDVLFAKPGDIVVCSYLKITEPLTGVLDGRTRQFGITSEKEILGIVEIGG